MHGYVINKCSGDTSNSSIPQCRMWNDLHEFRLNDIVSIKTKRIESSDLKDRDRERERPGHLTVVIPRRYWLSAAGRVGCGSVTWPSMAVIGLPTGK